MSSLQQDERRHLTSVSSPTTSSPQNSETIEESVSKVSRISTAVKTIGATATATAFGANPVLARAVLTGVHEAVKHLTHEQKSFLNHLFNKTDIDRKSFGSFSEIVASTPMSSFPFKFDTPSVMAIGEESREKVGVV